MQRRGGLYSELFGHAQVAEALSDAARIRAMVTFEVALARTEARLGLIPDRAACAIERAAEGLTLDPAELAVATARSGTPALPVVRALTHCVAKADPEAAGYVHWGATSQDVLDTALVIALRTAAPAMLHEVERCADAAASHAARHRDVAMPGRTWLAHAVPISFGLKAAGWLDALGRTFARMRAAFEETAVLQLGGAAGTLAALRDRGPQVARALASDLGLRAPDVPWHAHRDRLAALAAALGVAAGTLGKIARDVALLGQTEIGEAREQPAPDRGTSSTMPQKHNPVGCSVVIASALRAPGMVATLLHAMPQEHERGLGGWQAEWETLPDLVVLVAGAARALAETLETLEVNAEAMRANLELTAGRVNAEAVSIALASRIGRDAAHACVERACARSDAAHQPLRDVLLGDPEVAGQLPAGEIDRLLAPESYLGAAGELVERAIDRWRSSRRAPQASDRVSASMRGARLPCDGGGALP